MVKTRYGIIRKTIKQFSVRGLLVVPHQRRALTVGFPAFGPDIYRGNIEKIVRTYSHPETGEQITFRPATTSESVSVAAYRFGSNEKVDAKRDIFDLRFLQLGPIVRTQEGFFTNTSEVDELKLRGFLNGARKVRGIYLVDDKVAFAPYDSFERGIQGIGDFVHGGLARALEHTAGRVASNLRKIASQKFYGKEVNVWGFDPTERPVQRVASLGSGRCVDSGLDVGGNDWNGSGDGFAFGVLDESRSGASKNR